MTDFTQPISLETARTLNPAIHSLRRRWTSLIFVFCFQSESGTLMKVVNELTLATFIEFL
jgi:hypothetical protein